MAELLLVNAGVQILKSMTGMTMTPWKRADALNATVMCACLLDASKMLIACSVEADLAGSFHNCLHLRCVLSAGDYNTLSSCSSR